MAKAKVLLPNAPAWSLEVAQTLADESGRREEIPVRRSFVRNDDPTIEPPLARLISAGGRGGQVPVKLYLAVIWRCSGEPFNSDILARQWAALLGLDKPNTLGARRVTRALDVLEDLNLVELQKRRGESTVIALREESGRGMPYTLPSTAFTKAAEDDKAKHLYFKVPLALWTEGHIQSMSAAALAMLLIFIEERNVDGRRTWWSTERFPNLFNISPAIRSAGTSELRSRSLIHVRKESVTNSATPTFSRERVRSTYKLAKAARPMAMVAAEAKAQQAAKKKTIKRSTSAN